jgi:hypothetical protein
MPWAEIMAPFSTIGKPYGGADPASKVAIGDVHRYADGAGADKVFTNLVKTQAAVEALAAAGVSNPIVATGNRHGAPVNTVAVMSGDKMDYLAYDSLPFNKSVPLAAATSTASAVRGAAAIAAAAASLQGPIDIGMYGHGIMPRGSGYFSGGEATAAETITGVKGAPTAYMAAQGVYDPATGAVAEMKNNAVAIGGGDALRDYTVPAVLMKETCPFGWQCDSRSGGCWQGPPGLPGPTFRITPIPCSTQADDVRTPVDASTLENAAKLMAVGGVKHAKSAREAVGALASLAQAHVAAASSHSAAASSSIGAGHASSGHTSFTSTPASSYTPQSFHAHAVAASSAFDMGRSSRQF